MSAQGNTQPSDTSNVPKTSELDKFIGVFAKHGGTSGYSHPIMNEMATRLVALGFSYGHFANPDVDEESYNDLQEAFQANENSEVTLCIGHVRAASLALKGIVPKRKSTGNGATEPNSKSTSPPATPLSRDTVAAMKFVVSHHDKASNDWFNWSDMTKEIQDELVQSVIKSLVEGVRTATVVTDASECNEVNKPLEQSHARDDISEIAIRNSLKCKLNNKNTSFRNKQVPQIKGKTENDRRRRLASVTSPVEDEMARAAAAIPTSPAAAPAAAPAGTDARDGPKSSGGITTSGATTTSVVESTAYSNVMGGGDHLQVLCGNSGGSIMQAEDQTITIPAETKVMICCGEPDKPTSAVTIGTGTTQMLVENATLKTTLSLTVDIIDTEKAATLASKANGRAIMFGSLSSVTLAGVPTDHDHMPDFTKDMVSKHDNLCAAIFKASHPLHQLSVPSQCPCKLFRASIHALIFKHH